MGLETVNHISDLVSSNPLAGDNVSQGDDHIRNIKKALLADFPNINATVNATPTQLDYTNVTALGTAEPSKALTVSIASTMTFNGMTITDLGTVTTADINGGTLDGTVIGNSSRSSIKATTLDASQSLVLATGATVTGIDDDVNMAADSAVLLPTQAAAKGYIDSLIATATGTADFSDVTNVSITFDFGFIFKAGFEVIGSSDTNVSFATAFPTAIYAAGGTTYVQGNTSGVDSTCALNALPSKSGLSFSTRGSDDSVYWWALGR